MHPTIDIVKSVEISGIATSACTISDGRLAVGDDNGRVSIYSSEGELVESYSFEGKVTDIIYLQGSIIVGSSITGVSIIPDSNNNIDLISGCDLLVAAGPDFLVSDGSGSLYRFNNIGELLWEKEIGQMTHISSNSMGTFSGVALDNGGVIIIDENGKIFHESPASLDDVETISCMIFRQDVLVVARNSLGLIIDDRPENRVECWSMGRGLIHTSEIESLVCSICSTSAGVILGCFNGELFGLEIGSDHHKLLAKFSYPVSRIFSWNDDILVSSWFDIARISLDLGIIWSVEHIGIVEHISPIGTSNVAVLGDDKKNRQPSPIYILNPDSEIKSTDFYIAEKIDNSSSSNEFSGALSEDEEKASSQRPELPENSSDILDALDEELEIKINQPVVEIDLLENLSKSAKSLNLPPIVDIGEDKTISSDDQGNAIVLLDGSKSYDPDGFIKNWSWENGQGKVFSEKPQVKVKLSKGVHVFFLTVCDDKGASSKATLTIQIT
jgi:hypothetical protein